MIFAVKLDVIGGMIYTARVIRDFANRPVSIGWLNPNSSGKDLFIPFPLGWTTKKLNKLGTENRP